MEIILTDIRTGPLRVELGKSMTTICDAARYLGVLKYPKDGDYFYLIWM